MNSTPSTIAELVAHPDYPRLVEAGPRAKSALPGRGFAPVLMLAALAIAFVYGWRRGDAPDDLARYLPLVVIALVFLFLWRWRATRRHQVQAVPARVQEVTRPQGTLLPRAFVRLEGQDGQALGLFAHARLADHLEEGQVGVAFVGRGGLADFRRIGDVDFLL